MVAQVVGNLQVVGTALPDQGGLDQLLLVNPPILKHARLPECGNTHVSAAVA